MHACAQCTIQCYENAAAARDSELEFPCALSVRMPVPTRATHGFEPPPRASESTCRVCHENPKFKIALGSRYKFLEAQ